MLNTREGREELVGRERARGMMSKLWREGVHLAWPAGCVASALPRVLALLASLVIGPVKITVERHAISRIQYQQKRREKGAGANSNGSS